MTTHVAQILGTVADVHVGGVSDRRASKLEREVIEEIRRLESIFTVFDPTSDINQLRTQGRTGARPPAADSALTSKVSDRCGHGPKPAKKSRAWVLLRRLRRKLVKPSHCVI